MFLARYNLPCDDGQQTTFFNLYFFSLYGILPVAYNGYYSMRQRQLQKMLLTQYNIIVELWLVRASQDRGQVLWSVGAFSHFWLSTPTVHNGVNEQRWFPVAFLCRQLDINGFSRVTCASHWLTCCPSALVAHGFTLPYRVSNPGATSWAARRACLALGHNCAII